MHAFKYLCTSIFINATTILSGQCSVSRTIVHSPFILAVLFKRYETSGGGISTRNATPVSFPTDLEIPQEIVGKSLPYLPLSFFSFNLLCPFSFFFSSVSYILAAVHAGTDSISQSPYKLLSVIRHAPNRDSRRSWHRGHYITWAADKASSNWFCFDDTRVERLSDLQVASNEPTDLELPSTQHPERSRLLGVPYILFYMSNNLLAQ